MPGTRHAMAPPPGRSPTVVSTPRLGLEIRLQLHDPGAGDLEPVLQTHDAGSGIQRHALIEQLAHPARDLQLPTRIAAVPAVGALRRHDPRNIQAAEERRLHPQQLRSLPHRESRVVTVIELVQPTGSRTYVTFTLGGVKTVAELQAHDVSRPGEKVPIDVNLRRATVFDAHTERAL